MKVRLILGYLLVFLVMACSKDPVIVNPPDPDPDPDPTLKHIDQVLINTNGGTIVDEPKVNGQLTISKDDVVSYQGAIGIEIRGASSQSLFPKKGYGFETRDESNQDVDVSLLEYPEEEDWILHGPYSDKSLMRNFLIYDLAREMGSYASRTKFVELSINSQYKGVYVFMEKLKRDVNRININKLKIDENSGDDLTGGYILKIDKLSGSNLGSDYNNQNSFTSAYRPITSAFGKEIRFLYEEPKAEEITSEQKSYISTYVGDFEDALASANFADPVLGYQNYIDVDSFIDFFLLNELSNNVDGYRLSTYMHKDKNGKLKMGPIWDFNLAFGNANYCDGGETNVWAYKFNERCPDDFWLVPFWWEQLLLDPNFVSQLKTRWNTLRGGTLSESSIFAKLDGYKITLDDAGAINKNFTTWPILNTWIWPNNFIGATYSDEYGYLKFFISNRLAWLDSNIGAL